MSGCGCFFARSVRSRRAIRSAVERFASDLGFQVDARTGCPSVMCPVAPPISGSINDGQRQACGPPQVFRSFGLSCPPRLMNNLRISYKADTLRQPNSVVYPHKASSSGKAYGGLRDLYSRKQQQCEECLGDIGVTVKVSAAPSDTA